MRMIFNRFITKYSILQIFGVIALTVFFFSYLLVKNPEPYIQVHGVYYGQNIWPVGILLHQILGYAGWELFIWGMGVWTVYVLPIYLIVQSILGITIPFSTAPLVTTIQPLGLGEWITMTFIVIIYNCILMLILPFFLKLIHFVILGAKYAEINKVDQRGTAAGVYRVGVEEEFKDK